jgi:hypothetical protein
MGETNLFIALGFNNGFKVGIDGTANFANTLSITCLNSPKSPTSFVISVELACPTLLISCPTLLTTGPIILLATALAISSGDGKLGPQPNLFCSSGDQPPLLAVG